MLTKAVIGRLPEYLDYLRSRPEQTATVSSTTIAKALGYGDVQVRKDLAAICGKGKPKTGYNASELQAAIEESLGVKAVCEAVIAGAGKLGSALLGFGGFAPYGIKVIKAFDSDKSKFTDNILPIDSMQSYCSLHQIEIGIIAVPASSAQEVADIMVRSGIKAIWCFAVCRLELPDNITVQYENLALSFAHLKSKIIDIH